MWLLLLLICCRYEINTNLAYENVPFVGWQSHDLIYTAYTHVRLHPVDLRHFHDSRACPACG